MAGTPRDLGGVAVSTASFAKTIAELVAQSCAASGVPVHVSDPVALRSIAALLAAPDSAAGRVTDPPRAARRPSHTEVTR